MTWEETIKFIRTEASYKKLIKDAYLEENLSENVERFRQSDEFSETLAFFKRYAPECKTILDVGSGNGISAVAFALEGYHVTVIEPDRSETIGAGAIKLLRDNYGLVEMKIIEDFTENLEFVTSSFDAVYTRQAMHHAYDLQKFIGNCSAALRRGGILFTARDHVVFDEGDKDTFLNAHPLQKFYGGENAFTPDQYRNAMTKARLEIVLELKYFESVINYFPLTSLDIEDMENEFENNLETSLKKRIGFLAGIPGILKLYRSKNKSFCPLNEKNVPGRMYSYLAKKL